MEISACVFLKRLINSLSLFSKVSRGVVKWTYLDDTIACASELPVQ